MTRPRRRRRAAGSDDTQRRDADGSQLLGIVTSLLAAPFVRRRLLKFLRGNLRRGKGEVVYHEELQPGQQLVITHLTETRRDEKHQARADKKTARAEQKTSKRAAKAEKKATKRAEKVAVNSADS